MEFILNISAVERGLWRPVLVKIDEFILQLETFILQLLKLIFTLFLFNCYFSYLHVTFFAFLGNFFGPFRRINFLDEFQLLFDGLGIDF